MDEKQSVEAFYDSYVPSQSATGINDRIFSVYERMLGLGLSASDEVLELGCGIGLLTYLLKRTIRSGKIEAIDISEASIAYAKEKFASARVQFKTQDITEFETQLKFPRFITLIDVLEHIPLEKHSALFQRIAGVMNEASLFVINLPNPDYIEFDIALEAESLQVIDQPVPFAAMIQQLDQANLELLRYEKYGIWHHDEYQWFVLRIKRPFQELPIDDSLSFWEKMNRRIKRYKMRRLGKHA